MQRSTHWGMAVVAAVSVFAITSEALAQGADKKKKDDGYGYEFSDDPLNAGGFPIWEDTPFNVVRAPDGTTNGGDIALASWSGTFATAFDYRLVMTGVCFPCLADYNRDGTVDFFDYLDFVDAFSQGTADFNLDGSIDFFDYLDFVDRFSNDAFEGRYSFGRQLCTSDVIGCGNSESLRVAPQQ